MQKEYKTRDAKCNARFGLYIVLFIDYSACVNYNTIGDFCENKQSQGV